MKKCLNCNSEIDLIGDFCSTKCNDDWQAKNEKCVRCGKGIDLLQDEFKIENNGTQDPEMVCINCWHDGTSESSDDDRPSGKTPPPPMASM